MAKRRYLRGGSVFWIDDEAWFHRVDGPAAVYADGGQFWCRQGLYHFAHGPSDLCADGRLRWYEDRQWLRERHPYG